MSGVFILPPEKLFLFGSKYVLIYKPLHFCSYPPVNISAAGGIQGDKHGTASQGKIYIYIGHLFHIVPFAAPGQ